MPPDTPPPVKNTSAESITLFGQRFVSAGMATIVKTLEGYVEEKKPRQVCISNVHTTMMAHGDRPAHRYTETTALSTMDGQPLVWLAKYLGARNAERIAGPDLMREICRISPKKGYRHFLYGGAEGTPQQLRAALEADYPGIQIVGAYSPPFRAMTPEEDAAIVSTINDSRADFLWVGLGAPKQERWIADHLDRIQVPVQVGVGAAFDFFTGTVRRAPLWMQRTGLEWAYRLAKEPRRLWKRYFIYNTLFLLYLIPEIVKHKFRGQRGERQRSETGDQRSED